MRRAIGICVVMLAAVACWLGFSPAGGAPLAEAQEQAEESGEYRSPYRVEFTIPREELIGDLERTERGDRRGSAEVPHSEWYSERVLKRWGAWGPPARRYPPVPGMEEWSAEAKRERVIAIALRYIGYGYQHHHIPDWEPPREWPWKETCVGRNGRGVDCSNFTGFVYNLGFGLQLNTDVARQSRERAVPEFGGRVDVPLREVALPDSYQARIEALRTGDLLFIRSDKGNISHVVLWVGAIGRSPDGVPLIIDSHGAGVRDSEGRSIPCGVHIRPFRENSWYNKDASHALRAIEGR